MEFELWESPNIGKCPVRQFINGIKKKNPEIAADIYQKLETFEEYSFLVIKQKKHIKKLARVQSHILWEIRFTINGIKYRIPCIFGDNKAVLLLIHAFVKKEQKTRKKEIKKALNRAKLILNL